MLHRSFTHGSALTDDALLLDLAPALTVHGLDESPSFFRGFTTEPLMLTRALLTLVDITTSQYDKPSPIKLADPIVTASADRLRFECFSGCNSAQARLDVLDSAFEGGEISRGTTNVDLSYAARSTLTETPRDELLHVDIGTDDKRFSTLAPTHVERQVTMPPRWIRALGVATQWYRPLQPVFTAEASATRKLIAELPHGSIDHARQYWSVARGTVRISSKPKPGAVLIVDANRLCSVSRLLSQVKGMTVYATRDTEPNAVVVEFSLPNARLSIGLSAQSGIQFEMGSSFPMSLASPEAAEDADLVSAFLTFDSVIDINRLARISALPPHRVKSALTILSATGRLGWDLHENAYFHRELPDDQTKIDLDSPRVIAAKKLADSAAVESRADAFMVHSRSTPERKYRVKDGRCTCPWYQKFGNSRGPCKHVLAVQLVGSRKRR
ncbi:MAG: SWIM zinc finger family protein [Actinomycetaceae bacterium]|nr:SWIM zinc finger family protein [Actinomycetaceae bacterium]